MSLVVIRYYNDKYEGMQAPGKFITEVKSPDALPYLKPKKDYAYIAYEMARRGSFYELEQRYPSEYTAFGRYGELVYGWWSGKELVKELSRKPWGQQSAELPPGYSRLWQDDEGVLRLVSDAQYDELRAQWEAKHPRPQAHGTMVAWWQGEDLTQYIANRIQFDDIKSAGSAE